MNKNYTRHSVTNLRISRYVLQEIHSEQFVKDMYAEHEGAKFGKLLKIERVASWTEGGVLMSSWKVTVPSTHSRV